MLSPLLKLKHESGEVGVLKFCAQRIKLCAALLQQRAETGTISAHVVMKGRCNLDKAVQECFAITLRFQPDGFKRFMSFKVLLCVEQPDAFPKHVLHDCPSG